MNKTDLLNEPAGPRLDAWVAEHIMGWRRANQGDQWPFDHAQWNTDEGPTGWFIRSSPSVCKVNCDVWQPSVDIRAAWLAARTQWVRSDIQFDFRVIAGDADAPLKICKYLLGLALGGHDNLSGEES